MRTRACFATLLLAALSLVAFAPTAVADDNAVTDVARRRFQEGVKFFDQKKYEEARAAFLQAYALKRHPAVLLNLAQSEIRSGHPLESARHFAAFLRESPNASPLERSDAEKGLATARNRGLGRILVSVASGADVTVDGEAVGQAPFSEAIDVLPGTHTVEARLGGRSASTTVSAQVGKSTSATLVLESSPPAVAPAPPPPAPVPPVATTPAPTPAPPPPPAEPSEIKPAPEPPKEAETSAPTSSEGPEPFFSWLGHNGIGIAGVGVMVVGIGVGTGFALAASKASENSDSVALQIQVEATRIAVESTSICIDPKMKVDGSKLNNADKPGEVQKFVQACSLLSDNLDKRRQDRLFATGGFALAGVGLAATLTAYLLTSNRSSTSARALVVPVIAPGQRGLALVGRF